MASLALLIPIAFIFVSVATLLFLWAVKNKQFDDLEKEGRRILFDDEQTGRDSKTIVDTTPKDDKKGQTK